MLRWSRPWSCRRGQYSGAVVVAAAIAGAVCSAMGGSRWLQHRGERLRAAVCMRWDPCRHWHTTSVGGRGRGLPDMALLDDSADPVLHHDLRTYSCQAHAARGAPPVAEEEAPAAAAAGVAAASHSISVAVGPDAGPPPDASLQRELGVLNTGEARW